VVGKTYSTETFLPEEAMIGTLHYDADNPGTIGNRPIRWPVGFTLVGLLAAGFLTRRWITLMRDPYIEEVERLATRRFRPAPNET
jgi:hypothetical protein